MNSPEPMDYLKIIQESSAHVEDVLYGRKTIGEINRISEADVEKTFVNAQKALKLEDYKKAAELFQAVLVVNNRDQRALLGLAGALEGLHQYALAITAYLGVMMANFGDPVAPFRAGVCMMGLGKKQEALNLFQLAADCKEGEIPPAKRQYVEKARNMIRAVSMG